VIGVILAIVDANKILSK